MCRKTIRVSDAPDTFAASTYERSLRLSVSPRITMALLSHDLTTMAMMTLVVLSPRIATRTMTSGRNGRPYITSITRWISSSIQVSP
jgi:hypothetical protein